MTSGEAKAPAEFADEDGRMWRVRVLWGHPSPAELGIHAAAFEPADAEGQDAERRVGYVELAWLDPLDEEALIEALEEADPVE